MHGDLENPYAYFKMALGKGSPACKNVDFWSLSPKTLCLLVAKAPETPENERAEQAFDETFDRTKKY